MAIQHRNERIVQLVLLLYLKWQIFEARPCLQEWSDNGTCWIQTCNTVQRKHSNLTMEGTWGSPWTSYMQNTNYVNFFADFNLNTKHNNTSFNAGYSYLMKSFTINRKLHQGNLFIIIKYFLQELNFLQEKNFTCSLQVLLILQFQT